MKPHAGGASVPVGARWVIAVLVAWSLAWKGASLWRAAKDDRKPWFVTLLVSNTVGILDAIYLFGVSPSRRRKSREEDPIPAATDEPADPTWLTDLTTRAGTRPGKGEA